MKTAMPTIIEIETKDDIQDYRNSTGYVLAVGQTVVSGIINDTPTGLRVFPDCKAAMEYISSTMMSKQKVVANKAAPKAKKKAATKRKSK